MSLGDCRTQQEVLADEMRRDWRFRWLWRLSWPYRRVSITWLRWKASREGGSDGS
jgi:hypothetical protein